jgi:hypothetical protein
MIDSNRKFKSIAVWPKGTICDDTDTSTDTHPTFAAAEAVCYLLRMHGFGGNHQIYPLVTCVEEIKESA